MSILSELQEMEFLLPESKPKPPKEKDKGGRPPWELTEQRKKTIYDLARMLVPNATIATALDCTLHSFLKFKHQFPEIQEIIDKGHTDAMVELSLISWNIIRETKHSKTKDNEIERMYKRGAIVRPEVNTNDVEKKQFSGYEIVLVKKEAQDEDTSSTS